MKIFITKHIYKIILSLLIVIVFLSGVLIKIYFLPIIPTPPAPTQSELEAINFYSIAMDKVAMTKNLSIRDVALRDIQSKETMSKVGKFSKVQATGLDFQIIGFSDSESEEPMVGGGCAYPKVWDNYIFYKNNYYKITLHNIYSIMKPITKAGFANMIVYLSSFLNQSSCGQSILLYDRPVIFDKAFVSQKCFAREIDVQMQFRKSDKAMDFIYYISNITDPASLFIDTLKVDSNNEISAKSENIFYCNGEGVMY